MTESANMGREARRQATAHRISTCAQLLAEGRGYDGFTMDELAEEAGVSRRTLFNYYPGKDAAVLGSEPPIDEAIVTTFTGGGPNGILVEDIAILVDGMLRGSQPFDREDIARVRRLLQDNPRLFAMAKQRFEVRVEEFLQLIELREGAAYDELRARAVLHVVGALFDITLAAYVELPDREIADLFAEVIRLTRSAF
jgi:AcrR family transcriptional regulator